MTKAATNQVQPKQSRAQKAAYDRWLETNREDLNAKRRDRYHTDPEYREQVKARARERKRELAAERRSQGEQLPDGLSISLRNALEDMKDDNPEIKTHPSVVIKWSNDGLIPELTKFKGQYYLTARQNTALSTFLNTVTGRKQIFTSRDPLLKNAVAKLWQGW